jgi:predicted O-methyltransferase YrrM
MPVKYRLVGDHQIEEEYLQTGMVPRPLFDVFLPVLQARSIMAGVRLGIFKAIAHEAMAVKELARMLSLDAECVELLMRVLVCAGYVNRQGDKYRLTVLARNTLLPDSPIPLSWFVEFNYQQWDAVNRLEEVLQTGKTVPFHDTLEDPDSWAVYQRAMLELARLVARYVASLVPIKKGARKMLDIGGAHGLFGAMICRNHPPMRSEVLEVPQALEIARQLAREEGIDDVVTHRAGDALTGELGGGYDAVFLGNLVQNFSPEVNLDLLRRVKSAMTPGGTVVIWEVKRPECDGPPELGGDAYALFLRLVSTARCYSLGDFTEWLESAGYADVEVHPTRFTPTQILVTARVP